MPGIKPGLQKIGGVKKERVVKNVKKGKKEKRGVKTIEELIEEKVRASKNPVTSNSYRQLLEDFRAGKVPVKRALDIVKKLEKDDRIYIQNGGVIAVNDLMRFIRREATGNLPPALRRSLEEHIRDQIRSNPDFVKRLLQHAKKKGLFKPAS